MALWIQELEGAPTSQDVNLKEACEEIQAKEDFIGIRPSDF